MHPWEDPRVRRGMEKQLDTRRRLIAAGETPLGWKLGLGSPAFQAQLGITGPLCGFLLQKALLPSGDSVDVSDWTNPVAEPEIAIRIKEDVTSGAKLEAVSEAIDALVPAIELVDLSYGPTFDTVSDVLAANIFQRQVIVSEQFRSGSNTEGLSSKVFKDADLVGETNTPEAATGKLVELLAYLSTYLAAFGERLKAGDLVMTGSTIVPQQVRGSNVFLHQLHPVGEARISFTQP